MNQESSQPVKETNQTEVEHKVTVESPEVEIDEVDIVVPDVGRSEPFPEIAVESEEEEAKEDHVDDSRPKVNYTANPNVNVARAVFSPRATITKLKFDASETLTHVGLSTGEFLELAALNSEELEKLASTTRDDQLRRYLAGIVTSENNRYRTNIFESCNDREGSAWSNVVEHGTNKLMVTRPKFDSPSEEKLMGSQAVERMRAHLSLGSVLRIPLWHSGLWVTMKAPTEASLLELNRRIANEKITLGRNTHGLAFSNSAVYINNALVEFILLHIVEATYRYAEVSELKEIIKLPDMLGMIHGFLCTMYPDGYPYSQPCFVNPGKCTHVIEETISIPRIAFVDTYRLTEKQRSHMARKNAKFTKLELDAYQEEFALSDQRVVSLSDTLSMELKVPDLESYLTIGMEWIDQTVQRAERVLGPSIPRDARDEYIEQQANITRMCQFVHFVDKIVMNEDDDKQYIVEDGQTITEMLAAASANVEVLNRFFAGVQRFIEDSTITIFGVPKVPCPACSKEDAERYMKETNEGKHPYLLPLDIVNIFFTLTSQRLTLTLQQVG